MIDTFNCDLCRSTRRLGDLRSIGDGRVACKEHWDDDPAPQPDPNWQYEPMRDALHTLDAIISQARHGYIVVLYSGDDCPQHPGMPCLQGSAYGPYATNEEAKRAAASFPEGFNAHVLMLNGQR
jgi:hypothetical protein